MINNKLVLNKVENEFFIEINLDHNGNYIEFKHYGIIGIAENNRKVGYSYDNNNFYDIGTGLNITNNISYFLKQDNLDCLERVIKKWQQKMKE